MKKKLPSRHPPQRSRGRARAPADATEDFERRHAEGLVDRMYSLRLFVTGSSPRSSAAVAAIRHICDTYLAGHFDLEVVDLYQQPSAAHGEQIVAAPTLIRNEPKPVRRMVGSLTDRDRVLAGLEIADPAPADDASPGKQPAP